MRYTVLVVDDEFNQRRALVEKVRWNEAGFEVIGEAENGVEALDLVEQLEPDLIMTDIRMPMITGLELAAKVREIRPFTQIVILSGYDSFEYAQTAINYNIIRYLLKPISSEELSNELFEIKRRMDERMEGLVKTSDGDLRDEVRRLSISEFLVPLMLGSSEDQPDDRELSKRAAELGIINDENDRRFCVLVTKFKDKNGKTVSSKDHTSFINTIMNRYMHSETFIVYGRVVTLVDVVGDELSYALELPLREIVQTARRVHEQTCTIGVSREFDKLSQGSSAYFQAVTARRYTSDGSGEVRFIDDQERDSEFELDVVEKSVLKLEQMLKVGDEQALGSFIDGLYENNTPENVNLLIVQIMATVYRLVSMVSDKNEVAKLVDSNPIFGRITSYSSESVMKGELLDFCINAKSIINQSQRRDTEILCDRVIQIINSQYSDENLSLASVSNTLAVSPNYLSALIKKTKKKNFITLLTERRMKEAHDMLVCTTMKVLEVAQRCGYSDQHYFSYCFKKFYGESPNKVRSTTRGEG